MKCFVFLSCQIKRESGLAIRFAYWIWRMWYELNW